MNGRLDLRIIAQPYSEVDWSYFRRLVFGNSLTKHNKLSSFSYSVVMFFLPLSHIPPCYHTKPPDFPRLFEPRGNDPLNITPVIGSHLKYPKYHYTLAWDTLLTPEIWA